MPPRSPSRSRRLPARARTGGGFQWRPVAIAAAVALVIGGLIGGLVGTAVADPRTDVQRRIDALQVAEVQRDSAQVVALTDQARRLLELLGPVAEQLATALPPGAAPGPVVAQGKVDGWKAVTRKGVEEFANPPSAGTAVNIARGSLAGGARQLDVAVDTYAAAVKAAEADRPALLALAGRQRDLAVAGWSVGATQLDQLNVDIGRGHQHVFLPSVPGQEAMTSDGSKEGE
ncbi:hypothetical protein AB0H83_37635 [Dactylosporangium sp. NPDC050688]|uniref:hypothetical protein n=1 Tax=Dactylosporangium sp. NPDC050688 TaxID=3157217 RepID=UPI0033C951E4